MKQKVEDFLKKYGMHHSSIDLEKCCNEFIVEMENGLAGKESSLMMLPTYIGIDGDMPVNKPIIAMDAGGTNFRVAVVHFDENKSPFIDDFAVYPMPGTKSIISKQEFFDTVVNYMSPVIEKSDRVGFCFSFPTEILPDIDGKLIRFNKEVRVNDMENVVICKTIIETLKSRGMNSSKKFVILNDTVATMLGGIANSQKREFDSYIGFILGTGTNTCYIENNNNITKLDNLKEGSMTINMESGGYSKIPSGEIDIAFDNTTANPGKQNLEKKISGVYQGEIINLTIKYAIKEGLLSQSFENEFLKLSELSMRSINEFCYYPYGNNILAQCCADEQDRLVIYHIIDASYERAAKIVTVNLASIILKTGKGKNPNRPVCVVAEGTTFYKSKLFRSKLDYYIKDFLEDKKGVYCEFMKAENATLTGTAIAGLLN